MAPDSVTVPVVVLATPTVPASTALTVPFCRSKLFVLVKAPPVPLMAPLVSVTYSAVSE